MIITDKFVMINLPKTGSRFARTAIKKLYEPYFRKYYPQYWLPNKKAFELILPVAFIRDERLTRKRSRGEHGVVTQIPQEYKNRKIFSVVRDPFKRLLSFYYYADWKGNMLLPEHELRQNYPSFPDLTFEQFLDLHFTHGHKQFTHGLQTRYNFGPQTAQFIAFYAKDPVKTFETADENFSIKDNLDQFAKVDFLHTENLNEELYRFLLSLGYDQRRIDFIKTFEKLNVSSKDDKAIISAETKKMILERERPLFELFPEYAQ